MHLGDILAITWHNLSWSSFQNFKSCFLDKFFQFGKLSIIMLCPPDQTPLFFLVLSSACQLDLTTLLSVQSFFLTIPSSSLIGLNCHLILVIDIFLRRECKGRIQKQRSMVSSSREEIVVSALKKEEILALINENWTTFCRLSGLRKTW